MTGKTPQDLVASIKAGEWGETRTYRFDSYWDWRTVQRNLPEGRLSFLDDMVNR